MTKEEAIEILSRPKSMKGVPAEVLMAHNMAIQALDQDSWEDAIKYFDTIYELSQTLGVSYNFINEKIQEIITALKTSPQESCEDCISRQAAIKAICRYCTPERPERCPTAEICHTYQELKTLPPVTLAEKVGYWFIDERPKSNREIICSNCEQPIFKYRKIDFDYRPSFCPNCGAKMREVEK